MAKFNVEIDLSSLNKTIKETKEKIDTGIKVGLRQVARDIKVLEQENIAKTTGNDTYSPTGQLRRSVTIMPLEFSPNLASITVVPYVNYAIYVEYGTGIYATQWNGRQNGWVYPVGGGQYRFTMGIPPHFFVTDTYEYFKDGKAKQIVEKSIKDRL